MEADAARFPAVPRQQQIVVTFNAIVELSYAATQYVDDKWKKISVVFFFGCFLIDLDRLNYIISILTRNQRRYACVRHVHVISKHIISYRQHKLL